MFLFPCNASTLPNTREGEHRLRHRRLIELLDDLECEAIVLEARENFAWYTVGGRNHLGVSGEPTAILFASRLGARVLTPDEHLAMVRDEEMGDLPIEVDRVAWSNSMERVLAELCGGLRIASDRARPGTVSAAAEMIRLRMQLTDWDRLRYRELGRYLAHAVEATCRSAAPGLTEFEIAAELSHRLVKHGLEPVQISVAADRRAEQYPFAPPTAAAVQKWMWVGATARKFGLCASTGRTVCFGTPPPELRTDFENTTLATAAAIFAARTGMSVPQLLEKVERCYYKCGRRKDFRRVEPGWVTGYSPRELSFIPGSPYRLGDGVALVWRPAIGLARACDTVLVDSRSYEVATRLRRWPQLHIEVSGHRVERPNLLIR